MEFRQLRYFVAVADTLNFSRAAESLYVSQSALSKQIAELEQELGVVLLERDKRNVRLTNAGRQLLPEAKNILMRTEKIIPLLQNEADNLSEERSIHIAVEPRADQDPVVHRALTDAVYQQRQNCPELRALFWGDEYPNIKKAIQENTVDLGIFLHAEPNLGDAIETQVLRRDEMVLVFRSRRDYEDNHESILEVVKKRGVILLEKESRGLTQILSVLDGVGCSPQIRFCRDRTAMVLTMESGESTIILPESIARELGGSNLQILHFQHPAAKLYLLAGWARNSTNELTRRIAQSVADLLAEQE